MAKFNARAWYNDIYYLAWENIYLSGAVVILLLSLLGYGAWYGYHWYSLRKNYPSYTALVQSAQEFEAALEHNKKEDWQLLENLAQSGYEKYKSMSAAPYFLAFQAEALVRAGNISQAKELLHEAIAHLSPNSPIYYFYKTKSALLLFDDGNSDQALEELTRLSENEKNPHRDYAAYYRGYYYWVHDDIEKARSSWKELVAGLDERIALSEKDSSPWALLAYEKLQTLQSLHIEAGEALP